MGYVEIKRRVRVCRVIIEAINILGNRVGDNLIVNREHIRTVQNTLLYLFIQFFGFGAIRCGQPHSFLDLRIPLGVFNIA